MRVSLAMANACSGGSACSQCSTSVDDRQRTAPQTFQLDYVDICCGHRKASTEVLWLPRWAESSLYCSVSRSPSQAASRKLHSRPLTIFSGQRHRFGLRWQYVDSIQDRAQWTVECQRSRRPQQKQRSTTAWRAIEAGVASTPPLQPDRPLFRGRLGGKITANSRNNSADRRCAASISCPAPPPRRRRARPDRAAHLWPPLLMTSGLHPLCATATLSDWPDSSNSASTVATSGCADMTNKEPWQRLQRQSHRLLPKLTKGWRKVGSSQTRLSVSHRGQALLDDTSHL